MWITYILGVIIRAFIEVELLAIFLKSILCMFLKVNSTICCILSYMTEPVIYPVRVLFSKVNLLRRLPLDVSPCLAFAVLGTLDILFGTWF